MNYRPATRADHLPPVEVEDITPERIRRYVRYGLPRKVRVVHDPEGLYDAGETLELPSELLE